MDGSRARGSWLLGCWVVGLLGSLDPGNAVLGFALRPNMAVVGGVFDVKWFLANGAFNRSGPVPALVFLSDGGDDIQGGFEALHLFLDLPRVFLTLLFRGPSKVGTFAKGLALALHGIVVSAKARQSKHGAP